jgi:hypothetical protein
VRGKISNPYYEGMAVGVCTALLSIISSNLFFVGEEKYYLFFLLPILFVSLLISAAFIAILYKDRYLNNN